MPDDRQGFPCRGGHHVEHRPRWPQHAFHLPECSLEIWDVLDHRAGEDQVERPSGEGESFGAALDEGEIATAHHSRERIGADGPTDGRQPSRLMAQTAPDLQYPGRGGNDPPDDRGKQPLLFVPNPPALVLGGHVDRVSVVLSRSKRATRLPKNTAAAMVTMYEAAYAADAPASASGGTRSSIKPSFAARATVTMSSV